MANVIIKHLSGSKANRTDQFEPSQFDVLTLGRGTNQIIQYNPDIDDLVSREHATISKAEGQEDGFVITDLNSRNGTFVNNKRIANESFIMPGDKIQLGPGGPEFEFDLDPRPPGVASETREAHASFMRQTRESPTSNGTGGFSTPPKPGVGPETVEQMIGESQQTSRKMLYNLAAILIGVVVIVAGVLFYLYQKSTDQLGGELAALNQDMVKMAQPAKPEDATLSPTEIHSKYGKSTPFIEVGWQLIHTKSNKQVYHRYEGKGKYPAYLRIGERYYPWLYLDDDNKTNVAIRDGGRGSGFVITNNGFIMTNRHVAASWHSRYDKFPNQKSVVFDVDQINSQLYRIRYRRNAAPVSQIELQTILHQLTNVYPWVPANERRLVERQGKDYFVVMSGPEGHFNGRIERLDVTFPKNKLRIPAKLARTSDQHDVALIKVDVAKSLPEVTMYDSFSDSHPGDPITILGYPEVSPIAGIRIKSHDPLNPTDRIVRVPDLTVTDGLISKIIYGEATPTGGAAYDYYSSVGDVFQLTVNTAGAGSSGGPVFDSRGRVIGIFTYQFTSDVSISAAVPIRFGRELMGIQEVLK